jgi:hypothetical protein
MAATEDEVQDGRGSGVVPRSAPPGGGWRALLADVRGEGATPLSTLLAALTDASDRHGRWSSVELDELWTDAHLGEHVPAPLADVCQLGEVS